jgi:tetratricopeptide (TPR) repeat protein
MISIKSIALFGVLSLATTIITYFPGLSGGFEFDDQANIVKNTELTKINGLDASDIWQAMWSSDSGTLKRPIAMATFALQVATTGFDPYPMKIVNLAIHWLTGLFLFILSSFLFSNLSRNREFSLSVNGLSMLVSLIWLVHPLNLTSVSYIIQRMNSLSVLFTVLAILIYTKERCRQQTSKSWWLWPFLQILVFGLLGLLTKETAILLPIYLIITEFFIFRFQAFDQENRDIVFRAFAITVLIALTVLVFLAFRIDYFAASYKYRDFDIEQRLMTQLRVLVWYLAMLILPDISQMTLYHDGIQISKSLLYPISTLYSLGTIILIIISAFYFRSKLPSLGFGLLWFFGGHLLESTIIPLELVYEHRNYLPSFGIIFIVILTIERISQLAVSKFNTKPAISQAIRVFPVFIVATLALATHTRAHIWSDSPKEKIVDALNHPESVRANIEAGNSFSVFAKHAPNQEEKDKYITQGEQHFMKALELKPNSANPLFGWIIMYYENKLNPPDFLLQQLTQKVGQGFMDSTTVNALTNLTACKVDNFCDFSDEYYIMLMKNAIDNPNAPDSFRSNLLRNMATFYSDMKGDANTAIILTKRAIELNPQQNSIRLELVYYLAKAGYVKTARKELEAFEKLDKFSQYSSVIAEWNNSLTLLSTNSPE